MHDSPTLNMPLFDDIARIQERTKHYSEPLFDYFNLSARPDIASLRKIIEDWFERIPNEAKLDLRARFRSRIDSQHQSAFWELYIHELLIKMNFQVVLHPPSPSRVNTHPDFLVSKNGQDMFFLEATTTLPSVDEAAANARRSQVYDTLNSMASPNFFLYLRIKGAPTTPPPGARLRSSLERWLTGLDADALAITLKEQGIDGLPRYDWSHDGWDITFFPIPKSPEYRGTSEVRPLGAMMPKEARYVDTHSGIREAVGLKATKYGNLNLPFVLAINVLDDFSDQTGALNGLLGEECVILTDRADGTFEQRQDRKRNGAWVSGNGPQNTRVSATLVAFRLSPWDISTKTPQLIHNPWAQNSLNPHIWSMPQLVPNMQSLLMEQRDGASAMSVLAIPVGWSVSDE